MRRRILSSSGSKKNCHSEQIDKFKELARELEADEDETRWDERLKKVAKAKPKPEDEKPA